ncbi:MAG: HPP family protein [Candidatus Auribacterota bacterium]
MRFLDSHFRTRILSYLFQCSLATGAISLILFMLNLLTYPGLVSALGATVFIVFTLPHTFTAQNRVLIGGYAIGIVICIFFSFLSDLFVLPATGYNGFDILFGGLAVGTTTLLMVATDTEHPPAVGIALSLIIKPWNLYTIGTILLFVSILALVRMLLSPIMINLR